MSALDLSPAPGAAPLGRMVRAHALVEGRLLARNGEQVVLALVLPLLVLVVGQQAGDLLDLGSDRPIDVLAPGVLALAVLSTSFTSLAIATGFERRYGVLKRLGATPLPRSGLLAGKALAVLVVEAVQVVLLGSVALALGWQPAGGLRGLVVGLALVVLGTACFASWGLALAGGVRAEAALAAANLVHLLLLVGGGLVLPAAEQPGALRPLVHALPSGALADALRDTAGGGLPAVSAVVVLVAWTVAGTAVTARTFAWD